MTVATSDISAPDDLPAHPGRRMTEEEFVGWCGDFWAEWVDGEVIMMMSVNRDHADLHRFAFSLLSVFVDAKDLGTVLSEPFQIRFPKQRRRRSPDIIFISRPRLHLLQKQQFEGPPDLCIEIVSPESEARDWRIKFHEYEQAGVREYWILDPSSAVINAHSLRDGVYHPLAVNDDRIASEVLPGFYFRPSWLLSAELPKLHQILREFAL